MISRICARLLLVLGVAALAQGRVVAQARLDAADTQFGTEPAPYAAAAQPAASERTPMGQQVGPQAYAPGYGPQQDTGSLGAPDPTKPLGRGDIVTFSIAQDREPPQIMRVTDTGELDFSVFPKIGRISVAGRTCAQVAAELKRKLEADYYNAADVSLGINQVNHLDSRGKVYVTGNVRMPGAQDLPTNERTMVSTAIIRAGDFDKFADGHRVQVTRSDKNGKTIKFRVDVQSIIQGGHREKDVELLDGDYINVPQKLFNY
jgi:protein involved in polysaccharide export with SLBB domain